MEDPCLQPGRLAGHLSSALGAPGFALAAEWVWVGSSSLCAIRRLGLAALFPRQDAALASAWLGHRDVFGLVGGFPAADGPAGWLEPPLKAKYARGSASRSPALGGRDRKYNWREKGVVGTRGFGERLKRVVNIIPAAVAPPDFDVAL